MANQHRFPNQAQQQRHKTTHTIMTATKKTLFLFLLTFMLLIALTMASVLWLPLTYKTWSAWSIILIMVPIAGYTWHLFVDQCYTADIKATSPLLYTLGMIFSPPQIVLGTIFMFAGSYFLYPLLINHSLQGITKIIIFLIMVTFGSAWIINTLASYCGITNAHSSATSNSTHK